MMSFFNILRKKLKRYLPQKQIDLIQKTYLFAEEAHGLQKRSSGEPYIIHPMAVANILADMRMDAASIQAAILHDVLEDTDIPPETVKKKFGREVLKLVDGVSKLERIEFETYAETEAKSFRKMMLAMADDIRVIMIRLADRLHNMRTVHHLSLTRRRRIAKETLEIYAPIANRLGMRNLRIEFEELGFAKLYPIRYRILQKMVRKSRKNRKSILRVIKSKLIRAMRNGKFSYFNIIGREKHLYSIYQKMVRKSLRLAEVTDIYGFRIIVDSVSDCYRVLGVVHNLYKPVPTKFKDYIAIPKVNGYQSLHTVLIGPYGLPIEVQIRTRAMDHVAENGIASHWLYKSDESVESGVKDTTDLRIKEWVNRILEIQHVAGDPMEFIENVKTDLFPDEIYVFTPKGDIMELPAGATVIDFAYNVHTDVGNHCVGAKIGNRLTPLSTKLENGKTIEIITAKTACPNPDWLDFVITAKARGQIRHYLKKQRRDKAVALGKRLLKKALKKRRARLTKISKESVQNYLRRVQLSTMEDLFESIGLGNQLVPIVINQLLESDQILQALPEEETTSEPLQIRGTEGVVVSFAACCHPIPKDPIEGILTSEHGVVVHHAACNNLASFRESRPSRCMAVRWAEHVEGLFKTLLRIYAKDERGALSAISLTIAEADGSIADVHIVEKNGMSSVFDFILGVRNRDHLAEIMSRLRHLKEVIKVTRELV